MLSHIWMKYGSKLRYEELQIKCDVCHGWPIFSRVIALCSKFVFWSFLAYAFTYMNESWWQVSIWRVTDQVRLLSRLTYFFIELLPFDQNSFSGLFFTLLSDQVQLSSQLTDFFMSYWPLFKICFPDFSSLCFHMKVGRKLPYEELQIKFDFRHGWPTFSWVIALCLKSVFRTFLSYDFTFLNESW